MKSDEAKAAPENAKPEIAQPEPHPLDVIDLDAFSGGRDPLLYGAFRINDKFLPLD